jgi:hypothetical protein
LILVLAVRLHGGSFATSGVEQLAGLSGGDVLEFDGERDGDVKRLANSRVLTKSLILSVTQRRQNIAERR